MTSRTRARRRLLRWNRWIAHYPPTIKATPACVRAYQAANRVEPESFEWDNDQDACVCDECVYGTYEEPPPARPVETLHIMGGVL